MTKIEEVLQRVQGWQPTPAPKPVVEMDEVLRQNPGAATRRAFEFVAKYAPHLCVDKKGEPIELTDTLIAKIGAAEFKADTERVNDPNNASASKKRQGLGKAGFVAALKRRNVTLSGLTSREQSGSYIGQLVCRRFVVEQILLDYDEGRGKVAQINEYQRRLEPVAEAIAAWLLGETEEMPVFTHRIFPKSAKGNPVTTVTAASGQRYLFNRKTVQVWPTSGNPAEGWKVHHVDPGTAYSTWWFVHGTPEGPEEVLNALNLAFPNGVRADW